MNSNILSARPTNTSGIMLTVLFALLPAVAAQTWLAGPAWVLSLLAGCTLAILLEALALRVRGLESALRQQDGSVLVTAILLFLILPTSLPWWQAATGVSVAVIVGKHIFGGLGQNLFNPVALAYLVLLALFPASMTPDTLMTRAGLSLTALMLVLSIMAGGLLLLQRRIIGWHMPATMILASTTLVYGFGLPLSYNAMVLAAFFIVTDPVTSPGTHPGKLIYACLIALISAVMMLWLPYPAAIAAAVVCGNAITPTLDQAIRRDASVRPPQEDQQ